MLHGVDLNIKFLSDNLDAKIPRTVKLLLSGLSSCRECQPTVTMINSPAGDLSSNIWLVAARTSPALSSAQLAMVDHR